MAFTLENSWTFWTSNMRGDPDVRFISQFDCIQMFWEQFKAYPITSLPDKTYLHVFKDDIKPLWEDPKNFSGGHFKLTARSHAQSETMWQTVLLNMLGEQFPNSELVNGASVMSNQVGNNLIKVWLATTEKCKVQATREFLKSILNEADYLTNVTFVPHKLVVKGAGKKVSQHITESPAKLLATPRNSICFSDGCGSEGGDNDILLTPPRSPESIMSFGFGALSSLPSSRFSSLPPSPRPLSPSASYTASEWEADCTLRHNSVSHRLSIPAPIHIPTKIQQRRSWSEPSPDCSYIHNPYSLDQSVIYTH